MRILDLFCGYGGAGAGYLAAGAEVTGVDIRPQPRYPGRFVRGDAIAYVLAEGHRYDVIHASPPCQAHSTLGQGTNGNSADYEDLLPATRGALRAVGRPWIMENVAGAIMRHDLVLCGFMFGLPVARHRTFEIQGLVVPQPPHVAHDRPPVPVYGTGGGKGSLDAWHEALGALHRGTRAELAQSIPPAYTRYILDHMGPAGGVGTGAFVRFCPDPIPAGPDGTGGYGPV